jgi:RNA polymerase sigma-70 factor (ECF subfamily)
VSEPDRRREPAGSPTEYDREGSLASAPRPVDSDTESWLHDLDDANPRRPEALARFHQNLLRAAHAEVGRRRGRHPLTGPELEDLAHQAADDALVAITAKLAGFRGESRFTTWAYKFVIFEVSNKLGRHFWQRPTVAIETADWDRFADRCAIGPDDHVERLEMVAALRQAVDQQLTDHQRKVFVALVVDGVPLDALALRLGSNRNAIYKTMFDARRKLRAALVAKGHLEAAAPGGQPEDVNTVNPS